MTITGDYAASPTQWVRTQVDKIEAAGSTRAVDIQGRPVVLLTMLGILIGTARTNPGVKISHPDHLSDPARIAPLKTVHAALVSLGVDGFSSDPRSHFGLASGDFLRIGERIGFLGLPTVFVFEGGSVVPELGINVVNVLEGFETAA